MRKAQLEFVAIAGVIFIAAVVIALTYQGVTVPQPSQVPAAIAEEQKLLKDSIEFLAKDGGTRVIEIAERHGGYMTPQVLREDYTIRPFAMFMKNGVAYWRKCGKTYYPTIEEEQEKLAEGLREYLTRNLKEEGKVSGKRVELAIKAMAVTSRILDQRVDFEIDLPTRIENYSIREKYTVSIPTNFGRIYRFAMAFSDETAENRAFEVFTISSIWLSKDLPKIGALTECGDAIVLTPEEISRAIDDLVRYTVSSTVLWEPMAQTDGLKYYSIESVGGKRYEDLDITFWLSDGFKTDAKRPIVILNPTTNIESPVMDIPYCLKPYVNQYSVAYPVITSVKDELLGSRFNFASLVYVDRMEPGSCEMLGADGACESAGCTIRVVVEDTSGAAIEGATVSFGGCSYGKTDPDGSFTGQAECGKYLLSIVKDSDHTMVYENLSESDVNGTYVLHKIPEVNVSFYQLSGGTCITQEIDTESVITILNSDEHNSSFFNRDRDFDMAACLRAGGYKEACDRRNEALKTLGSLESVSEEDMRLCAEGTGKCMKDSLLKEVSVSYIPGGHDYEFSTVVTNPSVTEQQSSGDYMFVTMPIITEGPTEELPEGDSRVNIYVPDTDVVYQQAISMYGSRYEHHHGKCLGTEILGVCTGDRCDSSCARGLATADVIQWLQQAGDRFLSDLAACNKEMVEFVA